MSRDGGTHVAIIDYGLGNLYSVKHACAHAGLDGMITSSHAEILSAGAIILPGVGAYGDAMKTLHALDLVTVLHEFAGSGRPLMGICLGMQLLMSESCEFGRFRGLGLIEGMVVPFGEPREGERRLKVPQIGWNGIHRARPVSEREGWRGTLLADLVEGEPMYFVHSYIAQPADARVELAVSRYGDTEFCSALQSGNVMACQFHPERSGPQGLRIYQNLAAIVAAHGEKERSSEFVP